MATSPLFAKLVAPGHLTLEERREIMQRLARLDKAEALLRDTHSWAEALGIQHPLFEMIGEFLG